MHFTDVINLVTVIVPWYYLCGAGCPVGSNHLSGSLCVWRSPLKYSGYSLEMSLVFGARLCWRGGGG